MRIILVMRDAAAGSKLLHELDELHCTAELQLQVGPLPGQTPHRQP